MSTATSVLVVDDHSLIRQGWASLLEQSTEFSVVGFAETAEEAYDASLLIKPNIILMDVRLKDSNGIDATLRITNELAKTRVIMLTSHDGIIYVKKALKNGARGYLTKDVELSELQKAINTVITGGTYICQSIKDKYFTELLDPEEDTQSSQLTSRELEIATLVAQGMRSSEIAELLFLSKRTIDTHRRNILKKLEFINSAQLSSWVIQRGHI